MSKSPTTYAQGGSVASSGAGPSRLSRMGTAHQQPLDLFDPPTPRRSDHDWRDYLRVMRRRVWPATAVFVVVVIGAVVHGYTRVPIYQAKARLLVEVDIAELAGLRDPVAQDRLMNTMQMQTTILQSRSLARRTLQALGAWPKAAATTPAGDVSTSDSTVVARVGERPEEAALIDGFLSGLRVTQAPTGGLLDVGYVSPDPVAAARNVNTLVEQYIQQNVERKSMASKELTDWLSARLADQRNALEATEKALQAYTETHGAIAMPAQVGLVVQRLTELSEAYTRAKADRIGKEALMMQIDRARTSAVDLENFPALPGYTALQQSQLDYTTLQRQQAQLAQKLGDRHPELIAAAQASEAAGARLRREVTRAVESVRAEYTAARSAEQKLGMVLDSQKIESQALNRTDIQLAVLQRDAESNREIYQSLLQRVNEYSVTRDQRDSNIRVLDPADVPRAAANSTIQQNLRYGALGGLLLAVCLAFFLDHLDNTVKTPEHVMDLGLPFLGMVPIVAGADDKAPPLINQHTAAAFNEAIRGVRTNVRLSIAAEGMRSVVVTSTNAGEGKTLMASNLATALALSGERVMLVDADLRRPRLHTVFSMEQKPGLTNLLIGEAKAADLVRRTAIPNLHVFPSGSLPPNPSELLDSRRFRDFLLELETYYDWVIIDAPPIMPVTDAVVLADIVTGVLMVVAAEITPLPLLRTAIEQLERTTAIKLGAVLNRVDLEARPYYYSRYYRPDYKGYYVQPAAPA